MPGRSPATSTTAPAPSPNSTQVPRSFQSMMRENTSAPTTSAHFAWPERTNWSAVASPYTKPLHTACTSKAGQFFTPSFACSRHALLGKM